MAIGPRRKMLVEIQRLKTNGVETDSLVLPPLSPPLSPRQSLGASMGGGGRRGGGGGGGGSSGSRYPLDDSDWLGSEGESEGDGGLSGVDDLSSSGEGVERRRVGSGASRRGSRSTVGGEVWISDVVPERPIGEGAFSTVYKGQWQGTTPVAMKKLLDDDGARPSRLFQKEAHVLRNLRHPNVLLFLGLYRDDVDGGTNWIITEYVSKGSLLELLRSSEGVLMPMDSVLEGALDVCSGCHYLAQNRILHRDLASRNVLVSTVHSPAGSVAYRCKVADFGLSRVSDYYIATATKFPVKWTADEALRHGKFTTKSDVWSFGVLLWEMMELGRVPYGSMSNKEAMEFVLGGGRLDIPLRCPKAIGELMIKCWSKDPAARPDFAQAHAAVAAAREDELRRSGRAFILRGSAAPVATARPPRASPVPFTPTADGAVDSSGYIDTSLVSASGRSGRGPSTGEDDYYDDDRTAAEQIFRSVASDYDKEIAYD